VIGHDSQKLVSVIGLPRHEQIYLGHGPSRVDWLVKAANLLLVLANCVFFPCARVP
jgi:hypothetical protein